MHDLRDSVSVTLKSFGAASPRLSESFTSRCPDAFLCIFSFEPENYILPTLSGSCIPRVCKSTFYSHHMIITWVLYWPETLPPASAFPAAEAGGKGCLGCQTQGQIRAVASSVQIGRVRVSWFSGLCEG